MTIGKEASGNVSPIKRRVGEQIDTEQRLRAWSHCPLSAKRSREAYAAVYASASAHCASYGPLHRRYFLGRIGLFLSIATVEICNCRVFPWWSHERLAHEYKEILARSHVTVEVRTTA